MEAEYYSAVSEDGDRIEDPSEDALFMMIGDLDGTDNTFLAVRPAGGASGWSVSVTLLDGGRFEVVRSDTARDEHEVTVSASPNDIARELTIWLAARDTAAR
ncbi:MULTISPECIES: hypothetical protein [unclassified Streptomyces]|uniref:hypothetical protein n=1 Tax=unclassified Streptomyces TaxID=2593676 RepID=UPI00223809F6|nr:hypothetical protein [Streptomyces sp. SHP 1-2]MCW5250755.1 hypothetical protein [Streptomyces sp. SHP 1-2]